MADDGEESPERFTCSTCLASNAPDVACPQVDTSAASPRVPTPRTMAVQLSPSSTKSRLAYRGGGVDAGVRIVARWWHKPHHTWWSIAMSAAFVVIAVMALIGGIDLFGAVFMLGVAPFVYVLFATAVRRSVLVVDGGRVELRTRSLPFPRFARGLSAARHHDPYAIALPPSDQVFLRKRLTNPSAPPRDQEPYYDVIVLGEGNEVQLASSFTRLDQARFVVRMLTGSIPESPELDSVGGASPPALASRSDAADGFTGRSDRP